ncbi:MAG: helix-turn-helix domain-containing protein [Pirellulales bacterium]|nr:helix-turn-helix domain-containing protein [Pirellulales bacterium]
MVSSGYVSEKVAPELLTLRQVAELCGVSDRTVWSWARDGIAPAPLKIGKGTVRYSREAYVRWIENGCNLIEGESDDRN